jgi:hypothetical protein
MTGHGLGRIWPGVAAVTAILYHLAPIVIGEASERGSYGLPDLNHTRQESNQTCAVDSTR